MSSCEKRLCAYFSSCFQSISPGLVDTELLRVRANKTLNPDELYTRLPSLKPSDIADAVLYVLGTPPHVQVQLSSIIIFCDKWKNFAIKAFCFRLTRHDYLVLYFL
jgi:hypothetical protein